MKQTWDRLAQRFDALARRERLILLLGGVVVIGLLAFTLIDSALARQRAFDKQIAQARADQAAAAAQIAVLRRQLAQDPDAAVREQVNVLREQIAQVDAEVVGVHRGLVAPERMAGVLESMLKRNRRVDLVALKTLPASALVEAADAEAARSVYKHGIELTLEGGYLELLDYLAGLERLPWQMFWSRAQMDARGYPRVSLRVTVYTLSLDRKWLVI